MGDRCYLQITMRRKDLPLFGKHVFTPPDGEWWDYEYESEADPATVEVHEANYAWFEERSAAAKDGLTFFGHHTEGGEYGPYAFAACGGEMLEAPLDHEGHLVLALDDDLKPVTGMGALESFAAKLKRVKAQLGVEESGHG